MSRTACLSLVSLLWLFPQSALAAVVGAQRTAIILANLEGVAAPHPYEVNGKQGVVHLVYSHDNPLSAYSFYFEASYGLMGIAGKTGGEGTTEDVYGPFAVSLSSCSQAATAALSAANSAINYNDYERIVVWFNNGGLCTGSTGTVGKELYATAQGTRELSVAVINKASLGQTDIDGKVGGALLHEYGHNLGLYHADALECGAAVMQGSGCHAVSDGDKGDILGALEYGHPNAVHKDALGWLAAGRAQVAVPGGVYTLDALESSDATLKVLKVPRGIDKFGQPAYLYLEHRKPGSSWNYYVLGRPAFGAGLLLHLAPASGGLFDDARGGGGSLLLDTKPNSIGAAEGDDFDDAPLLEGETYAELDLDLSGQTAARVYVAVVSATETTMTVVVDFLSPEHRRFSVLPLVRSAGGGELRHCAQSSGVCGGSYLPGQQVTLTATPAQHFDFLGWRSEERTYLSSEASYTFAIEADRVLTAFFDRRVPAEDDFDNAVVVSQLPYAHIVDTVRTGVEPGEETAGCDSALLNLERTVWFSFTPSTMTRLSISTVGTNYPALLRVYRHAGGGFAGLTREACDSTYESPVSSASRLSFDARANQEYRIQVGGWRGAGETGGNLVVSFSESAPANDNIAGAVLINTSLAYATSTRVATVETGEPTDTRPTGAGDLGCGRTGFIGKTVWFRVEGGDRAQSLTVDTAGSDFDTVVAVHRHTFDNATGLVRLERIACADTTSTPQARLVAPLGNHIYLIQIGGFGATATSAASGGLSAAISLAPMTANLTMTMTDSPDPASPGADLTYVTRITNDGPDAAVDLLLVNSVPANTTYKSAVGAGWTCALTAASGVQCTRASLAKGPSTSVQMTFTVGAGTPVGTTIANSAITFHRSRDEGTAAPSASATTTIATPADLVITMGSAPLTVIQGAEVTYTLRVRNAGPDGATDVRVIDTLPAGSNSVSSSTTAGTCSHFPGSVSCSLGKLEKDASATITIRATLLVVGTATNTASVKADQPDDGSQPNTVSRTVTVEAGADLLLTKSHPGDFVTFNNAFQNGTYTLKVKNRKGLSTAVGPITVVDTLPASLSYVSGGGSSGWTCLHRNQVVTCSRPYSLPANTTSEFTITVIPSALGSVTNTATVDSPTPDPNRDDNTANDPTTIRRPQ